MASFTHKTFFFGLTILCSFSAGADIQKSPTLPELAYSYAIKPKIEVTDYNVISDFNGVKRIAQENWSTISTGPYSEEMVQELFLSCKSSNRSGKNTIIKVVRINGKIAGFMTFVPGYYGLVELLAVDANFRNQGIGYQLLLEAQTLAQRTNGQGLEIYVFQDNTPAVNLYEKFGFQCEANMGDRVILMGKAFAQPKNVFFCGTCELLKRNLIA